MTTTTQPRPRLAVSPIGWAEPNLAGRRYFQMSVSGAGCIGPDRGWAVEVTGPAGEYVDVNGGQGPPAGNWTSPFSLYFVHPAGRYTVNASCSVANGPRVFAYEPAHYDWAGTDL